MFSKEILDMAIIGCEAKLQELHKLRDSQMEVANEPSHMPLTFRISSPEAALDPKARKRGRPRLVKDAGLKLADQFIEEAKPRKRRKLSKEARARISAAQKKRWGAKAKAA